MQLFVLEDIFSNDVAKEAVQLKENPWTIIISVTYLSTLTDINASFILRRSRYDILNTHKIAVLNHKQLLINYYGVVNDPIKTQHCPTITSKILWIYGRHGVLVL